MSVDTPAVQAHASTVPDAGRWMARLLARAPVSRIALFACVIFATILRLSFVDRRQLSVDEAESSINALTILEQGYPTDCYLGLPIYENVLLTPTPHDEEYEFKDSSYSDKGIAIYHGWLPRTASPRRSRWPA